MTQLSSIENWSGRLGLSQLKVPLSRKSVKIDHGLADIRGGGDVHSVEFSISPFGPFLACFTLFALLVTQE